MMADLTALPEPFRLGFEALRARCPAAHVECVQDNFAYVWIEPIHFPDTIFPAPHERGCWVRIPLLFPNAQPHGIITKEQIVRIDGRQLQGAAGKHEICNPVLAVGASYYYSWTWNGTLGQGPPLRMPSDMRMVIEWVERRIQIA